MRNVCFNIRNYLGLIAVILLTSATLIATDFSGEWSLNEQKSTIGENRGRLVSSKIKVKQDGNVIDIERTGTNRNGEAVTSSEKLTLDGNVNESTVWGNAARKASTQWSADKKSLTINATTVFSRDGNSMEVKSTEAWSLSADGKILTIDFTSSSPRGTNTMKLVYDKTN